MGFDKNFTTRRDLLKATSGLILGLEAGQSITADVRRETNKSRADYMNETSLHYQTLSYVSDSIASGDLNAVDVTELMLERIKAVEPKLHSYYAVNVDMALEAALAADGARDSGGALGALHGVPIAVKDLCHKRGTQTTAGHSFRKHIISDYDATVVARLEAAGAVILGKLATTEGAMVGYEREFAVPRNPWGDLDRWPGVSSGGSGVATAAGLCFGSLGTDTGGSIRFPSAVNGVVGLKPTWGRVSRYGVLDLAPTLDHIGPMTRSVEDVARMLSVIAGHDSKDPTSLFAEVPDYSQFIGRDVSGLRIGWDEGFVKTDIEPYVFSAVLAAVEKLAELGAEIVEVDIPERSEEEANAWTILASAEAAAVHSTTFPSRASEYGEYFRFFLESGRQVTGVELAKAIFDRRNASGRVAPVFDQIDLLVLPTLATESFRYDAEDAYGGYNEKNNTLAGVPIEWLGRSQRFINQWDYNGYPTLSQPCGLSPDGMPLSLQLIGKPRSESLLLQVGYAFQESTNYHRLHPEV